MEPRDLLSLGGCSRKGQHSAGAADSLVGFHLIVGNGVGSCDGGRLGVLSDDAAVSSIAARMAQRLMCLCVCVCCRRCLVVVEFGVRVHALGHRSRYGVDASFYTQNTINVNQ